MLYTNTVELVQSDTCDIQQTFMVLKYSC